MVSAFCYGMYGMFCLYFCIDCSGLTGGVGGGGEEEGRMGCGWLIGWFDRCIGCVSVSALELHWGWWMGGGLGSGSESGSWGVDTDIARYREALYLLVDMGLWMWNCGLWMWAVDCGLWIVDSGIKWVRGVDLTVADAVQSTNIQGLLPRIDSS